MPTPEQGAEQGADTSPDARERAQRLALPEVDPIPVRVQFEAVPASNAWGQGGWKLVSVEPGDAHDSLKIRLFRDEAQGYYLNVTTPEPSIFVLWRAEQGAAQAIDITLSYDEAGRWLDGGEAVDRVPMPEEMCAWLTEYVQLHYQPETRRKRRGTKPSFMRGDEFEAMVQREKDRFSQAGRDSDRLPDGTEN
jgi:hypothetical protein